MTYVEEMEFLGWTAARKGEPFNPHAEAAWQAGYRFRQETVAAEFRALDWDARIERATSSPVCAHCNKGITADDDICDVCQGEGRVLQ